MRAVTRSRPVPGPRAAALAVAAAAAAACALGPAAVPAAAKPAREGKPIQVHAEDGHRCDPLDPSLCLYPWPNDHFTRADATSPTGRRLALNRASMPRNRLGSAIHPGDYNRFDGFSPGSMIVTKVPGLETPAALRRTRPVSLRNIGAYRRHDQPVVVVNARTGERHPIFAELDANPEDPRDVTLITRPAVNFDEGERYVVALRGLRDASGDRIAPRPEFRAYRDRRPTGDPQFERRRPEMERIFRVLRNAGIDRHDLYLAWDFTVASRRGLSERMLAIRDAAFRDLGDRDLSDLEVDGASPRFAVTGTTDFAPCGADGCDRGEDALVARRVEGRLRVPCYLDQPGCPPGSRFEFEGDSNVPRRNGANTMTADFTCNIPRAAVDGGVEPARPSLYGHGLLGSAGEVNAGNVMDMGQEHNVLFCATDWAGFATQDIVNVGLILQDLSRFPTLVDRTQQGMLNFLYLGRAMIHRRGFSADPAFRFGGEPVMDRTRLFYDGNSQGGILGGALTAVAPDFERAVLGVPGMNYSTLLRRSSDFPPYAEGRFLGLVADELGAIDQPVGGLYDSYPDELERPLILALMQTYWDRGEANGYAHHMTHDPLPDTPRHDVLLHVAFGDHQVTNFAADVEARTIGARIRTPVLKRSRAISRHQFWGIRPIRDLPYGGSGIVYWDTGAGNTPPPPVTNTPPEEGSDPHGSPRKTRDARVQKSRFLAVDGKIVEVCGRRPCRTDDYAP